MNRRTGNTGYIPPFVGIFSTVRSSDLRLVHRGYVKADWSENAQNRPQHIGYIPPFVGDFLNSENFRFVFCFGRAPETIFQNA